MSVAFLDFFARISSACAYIHGSILLHALTDGLLVATSLTHEPLLASLRLLRWCYFTSCKIYTHTQEVGCPCGSYGAQHVIDFLITAVAERVCIAL